MPYIHIYKKTGEQVYLHRRLNLNKTAFLYYFSHDDKDAIDLPPQLEAVDSVRGGFPIVRKKQI